MSAFTDAVQDFVDALLHQTYEEIGPAFDQLMSRVEEAPAEQAHWAIHETIRLLAQPDAPCAGFLSALCERCMARGADAWMAAPAIVTRLCEYLNRAERFQELCLERLPGKTTPSVEDIHSVAAPVAEQYQSEAMAWSELDLICGAATGILHHFRAARNLFRSLGGTPGQVRTLAHERPGVQALLQVLEDQTNEEVENVNPTEAVEPALATLAETASSGASDPDTAFNALRGLMQALFMVDRPTRDHGLHQLAQLATQCPPLLLGHYAMVCGSLVESGCSPGESLDLLLQRLPQILTQASVFLRGCDESARARGQEINSDSELVQQFGQQAARKLPDAAQAFSAVDPLCQAIIAHLARMPGKRRELRSNTDLYELVRELSEVCGFARFLALMLRVLDDEEVVVLSPEPPVGFRVRIHGVGDNFQLHALLAGTIVGPEQEGFFPGVVGVQGVEGEQPGRPLPRHALGVARDLPCTGEDPSVWSKLQLWTWEALQANGSLPENPITADHNTIVWNEGIPEDIPPFQGTRVILISHSPFSRGWNGGRIFPAMRAQIELLEKLNSTQVREWLQKMAAARGAG